MKTYKLILSGRGADIFIHPVNEEQRQKFIDMDIMADDAEVDLDEVTEILGVDSWDYADETYTGSYCSPEGYHIQVLDENEEVVWKSDDDFYMNEGEDEGDYTFIEKENILVIEHYVKGTFKEYELNIEGEFDPEKLSFKRVDVHEYVEVITDLKYDGQSLELDEYGDYWSKGCFFYLF
jgi:hypothetical protein